MKKTVSIALIIMILSICLFTSCSNSDAIVPNVPSQTLQNPDKIIVPNVSGQTLAQALQNIEECGFIVEWSEKFSFTVSKSVVISQNIEPGTMLEKNSLVSLVISAGIEQIAVPNLREATLEQAEKDLSDLGFTVSTTYEYSDTVEKDLVVSQSVVFGKDADKNSEIQIVVSKGPEFLEVPKLTGKTLEEAKSILSSVGFKIDVRNDIVFSNTVNEGSILSQDTDPGKIVKKNSVISVVVSAGKSNTVGNTAANLFSRGKASAQGNWIYFLTDHSEIYKYNVKTKEKIELYSHPSTYWGLHQINVVGEWVYFYAENEGIFKVRIDGTDAQKIINHRGMFMYMCVADEYIYYYSDYSDISGYRLYRMKIDGSDREKISDDHCREINIAGDYIYYYSEYSNMTISCLYRMKRDGSEKTLLNPEFHNGLYIDGNDVYILDGQMLLHKSDISNILQLTPLNIQGTYINTLGNWIYYVDGFDLYRVERDGTGKMKISPITHYSYFIAGDWIVFEGNRFEITIMKPDGSEKTIIHKN